MAITREDLEHDRLRAALDSSPIASSLLTHSALEASLQQCLAELPPEGDAWVFGYGSLIWNPMILHTERRPATTFGYHRGFYLYSRINRGTADNPGLVLGLDRGGCCQGVAFRVPREHLLDEFRLLWRREMMTAAYFPRWLPVQSGGERYRALAFVMNRKHDGYTGRLPDAAVVARLRTACGLYGPAREYLQQTLHSLEGHGIHDPYLGRLWRQLQASPAEGAAASDQEQVSLADAS
jgi:cation transport protein ChaC